MVVGIVKAVDDVIAAFRTGDGVPFARYGADMRAGQAAINRPMYATALVDQWLPAAGVANTLHAGGRIADLGCGVGWSTISIADTFPSAEVWGIDSDVASIEDARANASTQGVKVRFETVEADELADHGPFDAVTILEALHDMARPADVLRAARRALASDGCVIVADEAVADTFTAPGDDMERIMYGFSVLHCLPASMCEQPSAAIGTVIRESTVRQLAADAGFGSVEVLDVDGGFFRLYKLTA
jgi:2-polyprenyl-3-methyl-5-hydroxy-6-metoxy-1,4-benzoquinol methylase